MKVLYDILQAINSGQLFRTHIMHKTNLPFNMTVKFMDELTQGGFITPKDNYWIVTDKGFQFINKYSELMGLLGL